MKLTKNKLKKMIKEEIQNLNEVDFDKVKLPSTVERFLNKFVGSMKSANLNRLKRSAILYKVIDAAGMTPQQLMADIQKIKREMQETINETYKEQIKRDYQRRNSEVE